MLNNRVVIEMGKKKVFASALDWPGWSRSGKSEDDALEVLVDYGGRYEKVARLAGVDGVSESAQILDVFERLDGSGATDFGVPDKLANAESEPMSLDECARQIALLRACWDFFDTVASQVSAELRKGPRGGGRDRDQIIDHVVQADRGYARRIRVRTPPFDAFDRDAVLSHREAVFDAIPILRDGALAYATGWPVRYFIRRAAWHILDHAWEMEDKDLREEVRDG